MDGNIGAKLLILPTSEFPLLNVCNVLVRALDLISMLALRGSVKKKWYFRPKKYQFLFLLPFDAEAFKTCKNNRVKNTIKLINLCALPCLGLGLWLTLTVFFDLA